MKRPSFPAAGAVGLLLFLAVTPLPAQLQWESRLMQYEARLGEDSVNLAFAFSNPTGKPITITAIETSCGCTAATPDKKTYAPGEKGKLEVTFDAKGMSGLQQKTIQVSTDDSPEPTLLTMRITVPVWAEITPRLVWWKVGDPVGEREVAIATNEKEKIRVTSATSDNAAFAVNLEPKAGGGWRLLLKPGSTKEAMQATITVVVEAPGADPRKYAVFAQVR